jgi:hypothetical protein
MRRLAQAALLAAAVAATAGCPAPPPTVRPYPPPAADDLVRVLAQRQAAVRSLSGRARATSWLGGDRVRATVLMLAAREGRLRFEAEVSLQGTVATLVTDDGRFALLDMQKNELRRGPACPANVASLVRIPLDPADVAAILLGDVRLPAPAAPLGVSWDGGRGGGADVLEIAAPSGGTLRIFFHRQGNSDSSEDVIAVESLAGGRRQWRTSYEEIDTVGGARFPSLIRFAEGDSSFDDGVEIRFKDRTLNVSPGPTDFTIAPPPGVAVRDIGCGGR